MTRRLAPALVILATILVACAQPSQRGPAAGSAEAARPGAPKRVTAAILGEPTAMVAHLTGFAQRGAAIVEELSLVGLASYDNEGVLQPRLAESVPAIENGLWQIEPDGRMTLTWKIRPGTLWHDGTALTADDLAFAARVGTDRDVPEFGDVAFPFVDRVEVVDAATVKVHWKRPYLDADRMFGTRSYAPPMPKHLIESAYQDSKPSFTQLPYWSQEFVGTGPFKLRQLVSGSHMVLDAFDEYVLGRPRIDVLELRFFSDPTAMVGAILGGSVELTLGRTLSVEEAIQIRDQWPEGRMEYTDSSPISIYPQFMNANPPIITNVQFRRALIYGIDRQGMVNELMGGLAQIWHSFMYPGQPQYREIEARLPRYEYDPRKTGELIEGLGYRRGGDGFYRAADGAVLEVEMRSSTTDTNQKVLMVIADGWQRAGVKVQPVVYSRQAGQNNEYLFTFPGFYMHRYPADVDGLKNLQGDRAPRPENNYRSGNTARYQNAELDGLLERYFVTIPKAERLNVLGQILYHVADQLPQMGLFFDVEPMVMSKRLSGVGARGPTTTHAVNADTWDVLTVSQ